MRSTAKVLAVDRVTLAVDANTLGTAGHARATRSQVYEMAREVISDDGERIMMRHYTGELGVWRVSGGSKAQNAMCEQVEVRRG